MPQSAAHPFLPVDDYLAGEDGAEVRREYIAGQVYALTDASDRHGLIVLNIATALRPRIRGSGCQLFANDMKVRLRIGGDDIFYYPDLLLTCDPGDRETYYPKKSSWCPPRAVSGPRMVTRCGKIPAMPGPVSPTAGAIHGR